MCMIISHSAVAQVFGFKRQNQNYSFCCIGNRIGGGFFLTCEDFGKCLTDHSPPVLFFFFFLLLKWRVAHTR